MLKLRYQLKKDEIEEALLCMEWKKEGRLSKITLLIVSILGVGILIAFIRNPEQFFLFLLLCADILLLIYMYYGPRYSRKRRGKRIAQQKGEYHLTITESFVEFGDKNEKINWKDRKVQIYDSENVFTLKLDKDVFTIPKRILYEAQLQEFVQIIEKIKAERIKVMIKKE